MFPGGKRPVMADWPIPTTVAGPLAARFRLHTAILGRRLAGYFSMLRAVRRTFLAQTAVRVAVRFGLAGALLLVANASLQNASAEGDTRALTFHHLHTGEDITITFKRNGRYDDAALKKLDWFMRDWRKEQSTSMDPHLFDLLWEVYREVGATAPIDVVCGYRSPTTNAMLRGRSSASGVAELSEHT